MKLSFKIFTFITISLMYMSCGDDTPDNTQNQDGSVEMALKVTYDGQPLVTSEEYMYPDGKAMYFSRFSFYLSELALRTEEGVASAEGANYLYVGQAHATAAGAAEGYKFNLNGVKSGDYVNLSFGIGVPAVENSMLPANFPSDNDLSLSGEYWGNWNSYVFCKVEGMIDFDGDGIPESDFALHLGADEAFADIELDRDFSVMDEQTTELVIPIELRNFFLNDGVIYDIEANPKLHNLSQSGEVNQLARNLITCF